MMEQTIYDAYVKILREELVPAMGCTEPIAIAYAAAKCRQILDAEPDHCQVHCSGNIIKNVKGVNVPNAGGQKGVEVAAILGAVAGNADSHNVRRLYAGLHQDSLDDPGVGDPHLLHIPLHKSRGGSDHGGGNAGNGNLPAVL